MDLKFIFRVMILLAVPFTTESGTCDLVKFHGGNFQRSGIIHREFEKAIGVINHYAISCKVKIYLTDSFRKDDGKVMSAEFNNHFVGHAIDMNVINGSLWCKRRCLGNERKQSEGVKCFIAKIRYDTALRWGGDFSTPDPVRFQPAQ